MQKITVSTTGKRISVDMDEIKAEEAFWNLAEKLMLLVKEKEPEPARPKIVEPASLQFEEVVDPEELKECEPKLERRGYTGFCLLNATIAERQKHFAQRAKLLIIDAIVVERHGWRV